MKIDELRKVHRARPFQPFSLRLADGREYAVRHPEFMAVFPSGRTVIVTDTDDAFDIIDTALVVSVHVGNGRSRRSPRKRG